MKPVAPHVARFLSRPCVSTFLFHARKKRRNITSLNDVVINRSVDTKGKIYSLIKKRIKLHVLMLVINPVSIIERLSAIGRQYILCEKTGR